MIPKSENIQKNTKSAEKSSCALGSVGNEESLDNFRRELRTIYTAMQPMVSVSFKQLSSTISLWMQAQGFWDSDNFGEKIALIHSELSEALEAHRKYLTSDHLLGISGVDEELADAVIRIFDLAGKLQIDLGAVLISKMLFNLNREHKHGKAY